jgi:hypothetical protein
VQAGQTVTRGRPAHRQRRRRRPRPGQHAVSAADGVGGDAPISRNGIRMAGADLQPHAAYASHWPRTATPDHDASMNRNAADE